MLKKRKRRYPHKKHGPHKFPGQEIAAELTSFLNRTDKTPKGRRVGALIELFQNLWRLLDVNRKPDGTGAKLSGEAALKAEKLIRRIEDEFQRYPVITYSTFEGLAGGRLQASSFHFNFGKHSQACRISDEEAGARRAIEILAEAGVIHNVLRCAGCQQWFYRKLPTQHCCCTACRMRYHQRSEHFKEYKRANARKNYQLHKNKNIK